LRIKKNFSRKRRISSGDKKTDAFFKRLIDALNGDKTWNIYLVSSIKDKKYKGKRNYLFGVYDDGDDEGGDFMNDIFLARDRRLHKSKNEIAQTLLHEVLHIIFPKVHELKIRDLELFWWKRFSKKQRSILKSYIPKVVVNKKPRL